MTLVSTVWSQKHTDCEWNQCQIVEVHCQLQSLWNPQLWEPNRLAKDSNKQINGAQGHILGDERALQRLVNIYCRFRQNITASYITKQLTDITIRAIIYQRFVVGMTAEELLTSKWNQLVTVNKLMRLFSQTYNKLVTVDLRTTTSLVV